MIERHVKRLLPLLLPVTHWRVPVALQRGFSRSSGRPAALLVAGSGRVTDYVSNCFFEGEPEVEQAGQIPLWSLQSALDRMQDAADLTVAGVDLHTARLSLDRSWLRCPAWIASWMPVPDDLNSFGRSNSRVMGDVRVVRNRRYESRIGRSEGDFDTFYERFYNPYISLRHAALAHLRPRWSLHREFKRGGILWVHRDGELLAGELIQVQGRTLRRLALGIADGRLELLQQRVLAALYIHAISHAQEMNCDRIYLGGTRPFLCDGVFRYKHKWGAVACEHPESNYRMLLRWRRLDGPVLDFLSHSPVIHHDGPHLSGLWCSPSDVGDDAPCLQKMIRGIQSPGLHRLRVLLPGEPPPDLVCPPEVRLINRQTLEGSGMKCLDAAD